GQANPVARTVQKGAGQRLPHTGGSCPSLPLVLLPGSGYCPPGAYPGRCDGMNDWLEKLAEALGEPPLTQEETGALLKLAREVAHGVERKLAPPVSFLVGAAVGRRIAEGTPREEAFGEAVRAALALVPAAEGSPTAGPEPGPRDG